MITQFEQAPVVTMAELDIYDKAANRFTRPIEFPGRYFKASASVKVDHNNRYTFIKGQCYRLPRANDSHSLIYALIDKYLYNRQRNDYAAPASLALRRAINKIMPGAIHQKDAELQAILSIEETITHTYYGECISDDSDSDFWVSLASSSSLTDDSDSDFWVSSSD